MMDGDDTAKHRDEREDGDAEVQRSIAGRARTPGGPPWLRPRYAMLSKRSVALLEEAIADLRQGPNRAEVSLANIRERSIALAAVRRARGDEAEIERLGDRPIAISTIVNNVACHAVYVAACPPGRVSDRVASGRPIRASRRTLSRDLRKERAATRQLKRDIASLGGARARRDAGGDGDDGEDEGG